MSTLEALNLRLKWRLLTPKNQQKVTLGSRVPPRDVKNEGRTDYVYENKGGHDKMSCIGEGSFPNLTPISAHFAGFARFLARNYNSGGLLG
jgi:hypothetical protein